jgi:hypothetical protein
MGLLQLFSCIVLMMPKLESFLDSCISVQRIPSRVAEMFTTYVHRGQWG